VYSLKYALLFSATLSVACSSRVQHLDENNLKLRQPTSTAEGCHAASKTLFATHEGMAVTVNEVLVTGEYIYPLKVVLKNLKITNESLLTLKSKKIVSVAEGVSGLLPYLLSQGLDAKGLDIWYHTEGIPHNEVGQLMSDYVSQYGAHLIKGDATEMPLSSNSHDLVLSHQFVNNVESNVVNKFLGECVRVLKVGGEARVYGFTKDDEVDRVKEATDFLNAKYKGKVSFSFVQTPIAWKIGNHVFEMDEYLLQMTKVEN